jgi:hypothetical protein
MQLSLIFYADALALSVSFVCPDVHISFRSSGPTKEAAEKSLLLKGTAFRPYIQLGNQSAFRPRGQFCR